MEHTETAAQLRSRCRAIATLGQLGSGTVPLSSIQAKLHGSPKDRHTHAPLSPLTICILNNPPQRPEAAVLVPRAMRHAAQPLDVVCRQGRGEASGHTGSAESVSSRQGYRAAGEHMGARQVKNGHCR